MNRLLFVIAIILFFGCSNKKEISQSVIDDVQFSYEILSLLEEVNKLKSGTRDSVIILNYPNGSERIIFKIKNNSLDSSLIEKYESGGLKSLIHFSDNKLAYGHHGEYYDKNLTYYFSTDIDTLTVIAPMYKKYYYTDIDGNLIYQRVYDSLGNPTNSIGNQIVNTKIVNSKSQLNIGDTVTIHFYLVNEPYNARYYDLDRKFFLSVDINNKREIIELEINEEYTAAFYQIIFEESGQYIFTGVAEYSDILWGKELENLIPTKRDTIEFSFTVNNSSIL